MGWAEAYCSWQILVSNGKGNVWCSSMSNSSKSREDKAILSCLNKNGSEVWNDEYMNFIILTAEWKCKGDHRSSRRSLCSCEGKHEDLRPAWIRTVHDLYDIVTALFASTSCIFNCAMIPFAFISSLLGSNIYHFISIFPRQYITNHFNDQLPVGLISSID